MKLIAPLAIISAGLLALFLWFRPVIGSIGTPTVPDVSGRAAHLVPDGTASLSASMIIAPTAGASPGMITAKPAPNDVNRLGISNPAQIEERIFELTNAERQKAQVGRALGDDDLRQVAREHSNDMLARGFYDHTNPDGETPADRIAIGHRRLIGLSGENIARGAGLNPADLDGVARQVMAGWMKSPEHRANILNPEFTHLGVGVSVKDQQLYFTQNFAAARAFIDQPVQGEVRSGEHLNLAATAFSGSVAPQKYGFFVPNKGINPDRTFPLSEGTVQVPPGVYKLWFYFPKPSGSYTIYYGPQIEVK